jgi:maltose O-acetyltransferase
MRTEKQKMLAGDLYNPANDPELQSDYLRCQQRTHAFNHSDPADREGRRAILKELFGSIGENVIVTPPIQCDYGVNTFIGDDVLINFNCVILDCTTVRIGNNVLLAPNVQLYTAYHPTDPAIRRQHLECAAPITIGDNVWVGGGAIICPGVSIGSNTTIGAGSVVVNDIPANVVAVGNPCRVIRVLDVPDEQSPAQAQQERSVE